MFRDTRTTIAFYLMMGFSLLGIGWLIFAFWGVTGQNKEAESDKTEQFAVQSLITKECTSISGTTMTFSLKEFPDYPYILPYYEARDEHGVYVRLDSENYGQWKCKE